MEDNILICPFQKSNINPKLAQIHKQSSKVPCKEECALAVKQDDGSIICSIKLLATKK
ncbi:MAG: hypothetical protein HPY74_06030 [Firmicutes bacterium]|nr:hypothetical protein [Bacillota bacterium]